MFRKTRKMGCATVIFTGEIPVSKVPPGGILSQAIPESTMIAFHESQTGQATIVEMVGKLDASTTPDAEARLLALVRGGKKFLALDFGKVTYLASSGLRMLLVVAREVAALEGRLVLCNLDSTMRDTLEITGFLPYFLVSPSREDATKLL